MRINNSIYSLKSEVFIMTISKKLFLITAMALNLGSLLNAYNEYTLQSIFNFAVTLAKQDSPQAKTISSWLSQELTQEINTRNNKNIERIELIINAPLTLEEKVERLTQIKPNFIQKYALSPLYTTAKGLATVTATAAAVPAFLLASGALMFSMEFGVQMGREISQQCIEFIKIIK